MTRAVLTAALLALGAPSAALAQAPAVRLGIVPVPREDTVFVSFQLTDGFSDEVRAAILSGLRTTFTYTVDLRLDVRWGTDRLIGTSTVTSSVKYDNLTRIFTAERLIDGRGAARLETEDEGEVRQWLTNMAKLPLFKTSRLEPNREYYVHVAASARPSNGFAFWPFGGGTSGSVKFTFIP